MVQALHLISVSNIVKKLVWHDAQSDLCAVTNAKTTHILSDYTEHGSLPSLASAHATDLMASTLPLVLVLSACRGGPIHILNP